MDTVDRIYGYFTSKEAKNHPAHNELPNWELLSQTSAFDIKEVKRLYMRYSKICLEDGLISQARFMYMPELANCPFAAMAFNHEMEQARRDHLDFTHFVRILSKLSPKSTAIEKAEYFFDALQIDFGDGGLLERNEVLIMYKNLSGGTLTQVRVDTAGVCMCVPMCACPRVHLCVSCSLNLLLTSSSQSWKKSPKEFGPT